MNVQQESLENLAKRIQRLEDLEAIKRLITFYGRGSDDHHNIAIMGPLFADDAVLDVGSGYGQYKGRKVIEDFLSGPGEKIILWSIHYMISPTIDIAEDGRTAKGFWYLWEIAKMRNPRKDEEEAVWIGGSYDSEFIKQDDGQWKFKYVKLNMEIMSPYSEGWAKRPFHDFGIPE